MRKIFLKKYWLTLISALATGTGIILACAGGEWDDTAGSSFTPEAFANSSYRPFFYSGWYYYYDIGSDTKHIRRFNETNVDDWSTYLGNSVPRAELDYLLNAATREGVDSALMNFAGKLKVVPPAMQPFQLFKNKTNRKVQSFINYLSFAKKCETFAVNYGNHDWNYEPDNKKVDSVNTMQLNSELLQAFNKTKDVFFKERYWFQLVRSYFFNEPLQPTIDFFEKNEKLFQKNTLYYRTMAYAAGAYKQQKNYSKANYYYSKVYDGCDDLKTVAHFSFHPQEEADWKATLALCANNDEKATLWQMLGIFYSDEKRAMQEIYSLNPHSEKLDLLLARAVNIQESKFTAWNEDYNSNAVRFIKDSVSKDLLSLVTRIAQAGNTGKPYMWHMAAGYLYMMNGNTDKAMASLSLAEKNLPNEKLLHWQLRLLKLINTVAAVDRIDSKLEDAILSDVEWLRTINSSEPAFRYATAFAWIKQTISDKYLQQHEYIKAVCFKNYGAFYVNNSQVEAMKSFLEKTNKSPYELLCARLYIITENDLIEYQAIRLTFDDKLEEAIAKMEPASSDLGLGANPFNGRLQDCHDCDHNAQQKVNYTKLSLLKKMKEMEDKIKAGADVYTNAMLVANAHYNITHYGNARSFYECSVLGNAHVTPFGIDSVFRSFLTDMKIAAKYYTMALNAAKTDEQKAKCHFMLAKCERNQWYNETYYAKSNNEYTSEPSPDFLPWNGFKVLQQQ